MAVCRECNDGKCRNCDGVALDDKTDEFVECACHHVGGVG